jgi:hypothetical protein
MMALASELSAPSVMNKEQAIDFYEQVAEQCSDWAQTIRAELDKPS